jgi:hypothetical protein
MELLKRTFPAPKGVREFKTIEIREVNGEDEIAAAIVADGKKAQTGKDWSPQVELIRMSIVSLDGNPVGGAVPFVAFDRWTTRARNAVLRFYDIMNGLDDSDLKACVAAAMATEQTSPTKAPSKEEAPTIAPNGG